MLNLMTNLETFEFLGLNLKQLIIIVGAIIVLIGFVIAYSIAKKKNVETGDIEVEANNKNAFGHSTLAQIRTERVSVSVPTDSKNYRVKNWIKGIKK